MSQRTHRQRKKKSNQLFTFQKTECPQHFMHALKKKSVLYFLGLLALDIENANILMILLFFTSA